MKLGKPSKKSIIIACSVIAVAGCGIAYYVNSREKQSGVAWMDSNWQYRRTVTLSASGSNIDVLISLDTATLISQGKMKSDCSDLRLVDSDDTTLLQYWVEGGCNTSTTQIWTKVPSSSSGKIIYMYYGNSSASSGAMSWSGKVITLAESSCPSGWTRESAFDNRFIMGSSSYGTTGGSNSHNHGGSFSGGSGGASSAGYIPGGDVYVCQASGGHGHTVTGTISSVSSAPPYATSYVCSRNTISGTNNQIFLSDSSTPSGWSRISTFDGKFPYGSSSFGATGGATTHTHTLSSLASSTAPSNACANVPLEGSSTRDVQGSHSHSVSNTANPSASNYPPYKTLLYVKDPVSIVNAPIISMFSVLPPLGWTRYSDLDNVFVLGGSSVNLTTQGSSTHSHVLKFSLPGFGSYTRLAAGSSIAFAGVNHSHTATITISGSSLPAYISVIYGKRNTSQSVTIGGEISANIIPNAPTSLLTNSLTNPTGMPKNPKFSAIFSDPDSADKGKSYQIQVNTSSGFNGTMMWDSGKKDFSTLVNNGSRSEDIQFPTETLNWGVTYYWRIKMWDNASLQGESAWSSTAQFKVNIQPTVSNLLTNSLTNPTGVLKYPKFSAIFSDSDSTDKGKSYQVQVNTSSNFNGTMMWDSGKQDFTTLVNNGGRSEDIQFPTDTLNWGITYYWRIKMWDNNSYQADSAWSETAQFTMNYKPAPTDLRVNGEISPVGVDITIDPMFTAIYNDNDPPDTCVSYQIQMNTTSAFDGIMKWNTEVLEMPGPIANGSRIPPIKYNGTPMLNGITYYWRIKLGDDKGAMSDWSETATFRSNYQPNKPTGMLLNGLVNPVGVGLNPLPTFSAVFSDPDGTDVCKTYQIQLNTRRTFDGTMKWDSQVIDVVGNVGNNERIPEVSYGAYGGSELKGGTTYYWRIKLGDNKHTQSEWSDVMEFKTNYEPNAPTELLTEGQVNPEKVSLTPTFSAKYTDNDANNTAVAYQILVDMTPDFAEPLVWDSGKTFFTDPVSNGSRTPEIPYGGTGGILEGGRYYWKIRVWDDKDGMSNYSMISQFGTHSRPSSPTGLEMNGSSSPGVLNSKMMSFSAIYYDEDGDRASAYQLQISTSSGFDSIVLDSGKKSTNVASGTRSDQYYYDGSSLLSNSGTTYYWRIRFYDTDDMEGEWSSNGIFYDSLAPSSILFEGVQMEGIKVN